MHLIFSPEIGYPLEAGIAAPFHMRLHRCKRGDLCAGTICCRARTCTLASVLSEAEGR